MATRLNARFTVVSRPTNSSSFCWRKTCNIHALSLPLLQERSARGFTVLLLSADAEAQPGAEVCLQRRISHNFLIAMVQQIFDVHVSRDPVIHRIPSARINTRVSGGVVDG